MGRSQRHMVSRDGYAADGNNIAEGAIREGNQLPTLASLAPNTVAHGVANAVVTATGTLFTAQSKIVYGGVDLATTFTNATTISATFPHSTAVAGTVPIRVRTGELYSGTVNFTYT